MPVWNKVLAALTLSALFAVPAFADGTPGQSVNRGPEPVRAHQPVPPEPGCYLIEDGQAWSCPARAVEKPVQTPVRKATGTPCCGTFTQTIVKQHPPVVTSRTVTHRAAPQQKTVTRRAVTQRRAVQKPSGLRLDMASFSGGVGGSVDGGFYGGGGAVVITAGRSFSGVLSHRASSYSFRSGHRTGGKKRGGGCGCK